MNKVKIDIVSIYKYENNEIEKIEILNKEFILKEDKYISEDMHIYIKNNKIEVRKIKDIEYIKKYELNKKVKSEIFFNNDKIITKILTKELKKLNKTYIITASEYNYNDEKILDVKIKIRIKGD